jgi:hypothetical protein
MTQRIAELEAAGWTRGTAGYENYMFPEQYSQEQYTESLPGLREESRAWEKSPEGKRAIKRAKEEEARWKLSEDERRERGYQRGGEFDYWKQNADALMVANREGGHHYAGSGSGRDDTIDAQLSDGEYVMDSETVALLGDGSLDEGAARLDEMRENLRKHKAENFRQGKFSKAARSPQQYMARGGRRKKRRGGRRRMKYEHGGEYPMSAGEYAKGGQVKVDEIVDAMAKEMGV